MSLHHTCDVVQMLNLDLVGNGDSRWVNESIKRAMKGLTPSRKEFISSCLTEDPSERRTASDLIKSKVLQEVSASVCMCVWVRVLFVVSSWTFEKFYNL